MIELAPIRKDIYQHSYWDNCFDILGLERIRDYCEEQERTPHSQEHDDGECIRKADISWIEHVEEAQFFIEPLMQVVRRLNSQFYEFDIRAMYEPFQYSVYLVGDHYGAWHIDGEKNELDTPRKLSLTLQLSRPELLIGTQQEHKIASKDFGAITVFPSFMTHTVTPITKGKRRSLVAWISGPAFR
jgi:PKHD-type hydroxylase